jgi:hypothetical protein
VAVSRHIQQLSGFADYRFQVRRLPYMLFQQLGTLNYFSGRKNTTLHMEDVLVNRTFVDDLVRDGKLLDAARANEL